MKQEQVNSDRAAVSTLKNAEYLDTLIEQARGADAKDDKNFRQQLAITLIPYILGNKAQDLQVTELTVGPDGKETRNTKHRWIVDMKTGDRVKYLGTSDVINPPAPHETPGRMTEDQRLNNEEQAIKTAKANAMSRLKVEFPNGIVTNPDGSMSFVTGPTGDTARAKFNTYLSEGLESYVKGGLVSQGRANTEKSALGITTPKADYVWDPVQKKLVPAK